LPDFFSPFNYICTELLIFDPVGHYPAVHLSPIALGGVMTIVVKAYAKADDVLIAWRPDQWDWVGSNSSDGTTRRNE
jgi:hypothetical protein